MELMVSHPGVQLAHVISQHGHQTGLAAVTIALRGGHIGGGVPYAQHLVVEEPQDFHRVTLTLSQIG